MVRRFAVAGLINTHPDAVVIPATNVQQMAQYIERECCVVIDSVTYSKLLPTDLTALLRSGPSLLIGTLQATKDGQFRGSNEFAHEADVIIKVDQGEWEIMKNRYGSVGGTGEVRFQ